MKRKAILAMLVAVSLVANVRGALVVDSFEGPNLSDFWQPYGNNGQVVFPSAMAHDGQQGIRLETFPDDGHPKGAGVIHDFGSPQYGSASIWVYDYGADQPSSNYWHFKLFNGKGDALEVYTFDYDLGDPGNGANYYLTPLGGPVANSGIDRTVGWHFIELALLADKRSISIDGQQVFVGPGGLPFTGVQLEEHAPGWRPAWIADYDQFTISAAAVPSPTAIALLPALGGLLLARRRR